MKFICVVIAIAFIAVVDAAAPKAQNLCDRIVCSDEAKVQVCANNGSIYKVFDNACELRKYNCNKGQRFAAVDTDACILLAELGMGFMIQMK